MAAEHFGTASTNIASNVVRQVRHRDAFVIPSHVRMWGQPCAFDSIVIGTIRRKKLEDIPASAAKHLDPVRFLGSDDFQFHLQTPRSHSSEGHAMVGFCEHRSATMPGSPDTAFPCADFYRRQSWLRETIVDKPGLGHLAQNRDRVTLGSASLRSQSRR